MSVAEHDAKRGVADVARGGPWQGGVLASRTVTIGQTPDGRDATNELSYVILESTRGLKSSYPELAAQIHVNTPDRFLHAVADTNKDGKGSPKLINDEFLIPYFLSHGVPVREALDYAASGCCESRVPTVKPTEGQLGHQLRRRARNDLAERANQALGRSPVRSADR